MSKIKILITGIVAFFIIGLIAAAASIFIYVRILWVIVVLFVSVFIIDAIFGFYILNSERHFYTKTCWLFALLLLPLVGCLIFVVFGTIPMTRKKWKEYNNNQAKYVRFENFNYSNSIRKSADSNMNLFFYSLNSSLKPIYINNNIRTIESNTALYKEAIDLIRSAKEFIHFETYIIHDGFFLRTFFAELIKKAKEGVKIRFLYDWYGSYYRFKKGQLKELKEAGIEIAIFNPKGINMFKGTTNYRLHRKALIIDNKIALYGGSNIGDEYLSLDPMKYYWRDQNYIVEGEIVNTINVGFCSDWVDFTEYTLSSKQRQDFIRNLKDVLVIHKNENKANMQLVSSSPNYAEKGVLNSMINLFLRATKSIKIITPYFLPTDILMSALTIASWGGVEVEIIVPGRRDNKDFVVHMNRTNYQQLLDAKCKVYEYNGFIHSKYIIIDDQFVLTGSSNLDFRSLWINFENALLIENRQFAKRMSDCFQEDKNNTVAATQELVDKERTMKNKIKNLILSTYKPLL